MSWVSLQCAAEISDPLCSTYAALHEDASSGPKSNTQAASVHHLAYNSGLLLSTGCKCSEALSNSKVKLALDVYRSPH